MVPETKLSIRVVFLFVFFKTSRSTSDYHAALIACDLLIFDDLMLNLIFVSQYFLLSRFPYHPRTLADFAAAPSNACLGSLNP